MTALCPGGGPSAPRAGVDASIQFNGTQVAAALAISGEEEIAALVAVVTSGTVLATDLFCGTDPPAAVTLTDQDFADVKNPLNPAAFTTAAGRIKDYFLRWYWFQICDCTGGATPSAPPIVLPTGTGTGTGLPTGTTSDPCWSTNGSFTVPAFHGTSGQSHLDVTAQMLPALAPTLAVTGGGDNATPIVAQSIPAGVNHISVTGQFIPPTLTGSTAGFGIDYYNSTGTRVGATQFTATGNASSGGSATSVTIPSGAVYWGYWLANADPNDKGFNVTATAFCSNAPNALQVPCCPPDPLTQNYLQLILNLVQNLYTAPAGTPSTGWADGAAHPNLSGTGSFQLGTNVTGIRANFSTIPPNVRTTPGTPTFYWDLGFVTPVAMVVPLRSLRTVFQTQAMPLPVQTTAIDYTFPPGAVVTLTELHPA